MAYGELEQRCNVNDIWNTVKDKPWKQKRRSAYSNYLKKAKHKKERRKVKFNIECFPAYNKFHGYEF